MIATAKEYVEFTKRTGKELPIHQEDQDLNKAFAEEYEKYRVMARKVPQMVAVIDDVTTIGGPYGPISSYPEPMFGSDWDQVKEYRKLVYREDIVKELGRIAHKNPDSGIDKLLFITTEKLSSSFAEEIRITAAATTVKARDYKLGETHLGKEIPGAQVEQTVLGEVTREASKAERLAWKKQKKDLEEKMRQERDAKRKSKV